MDINNIIAERNLPEFLEREEMIKLLLDNVYGNIPDTKYSISISEPEVKEARYLAGTVCHSVVNMTVKSEYGEHTFPVNQVLHNDGKKHPFFILINFRADVPDRYYPTEEIADEGFDVLTFCYKDVSSESCEFDGLAKVLMPNGQENGDTCGKIMLWSWAARRVLDYAESLGTLDMDNAYVIGHSRLGKTALVTAMLDERVSFVCSNCSGNSGASITRGRAEGAERIKDIIERFPYWFCKNYAKYTEIGYIPEADQHFLIGSIAPRKVYIVSASFDAWADPDSEFLNCVASSGMYEKMGLKGIVHNGEIPEVGVKLNEGNIGYYNHYGNHFLSRHTWKAFIEFIRLHTN